MDVASFAARLRPVRTKKGLVYMAKKREMGLSDWPIRLLGVDLVGWKV